MMKRKLCCSFIGLGLLGGLSGCALPEKKAELFDEGYWRGASDALKRHYWMKQAAEREGTPPTKKPITYEYPLPVQTDDGRKLVPETATVEWQP